MRKQLLAVLLPLLILALIAGAETQSTSTGADTRATVQKVDVMHADDGISVEITAQGQVTPKLSTLDSPARVLVTLPNTVAATVQNHISVGSDGVKERAHRHRWPCASNHQRGDRPGAGLPIRTASGRRQQNHCQVAPCGGEGQHEGCNARAGKAADHRLDGRASLG